MSVIVSGSGGGSQKILLDGAEYKGELKLSTKYQWLEQSVLPINAVNGYNFISYENELYIFSEGVYKLNGVLWEKIMSYPDNEIYFPVIVGNELFALSKKGVYKVDTTQLSFTKIVDLPFVSNDMPIGVEYNGKLNVVFRYYVNSANTYPHYELDGTTWTKISEVPTNVYFSTYSSAIGVFNDELHILGGYGGSYHPYMVTTHIKLNGTSWVNDIETPFPVNSSCILIENDNIYLINYNVYYMYGLKNGSWEQYLYLNDLHLYGSIIRHKGDFHIFGGSTDDSYRKTLTNHFAFKKVLCLED